MRVASRLDIPLLAVVAAFGLSACGQPQQQGGFHGFPPADVTLMTVEAKSIPVTFEYVGQALGSKEVEVRARVGGILEKRLFKEGAPVKAGQTLFIVDPKPYEAQAASVQFPKIAVSTLACACIRGVELETCGGTLFNADGTATTSCTQGFGDTMTCPTDQPCTSFYGPGNSATGFFVCGANGFDRDRLAKRPAQQI